MPLLNQLRQNYDITLVQDCSNHPIQLALTKPQYLQESTLTEFELDLYPALLSSSYWMLDRYEDFEDLATAEKIISGGFIVMRTIKNIADIEAQKHSIAWYSDGTNTTCSTLQDELKNLDVIKLRQNLDKYAKVPNWLNSNIKKCLENPIARHKALRKIDSNIYELYVEEGRPDQEIYTVLSGAMVVGLALKDYAEPDAITGHHSQ